MTSKTKLEIRFQGRSYWVDIVCDHKKVKNDECTENSIVWDKNPSLGKCVVHVKESDFERQSQT